jgi:hypothetical protein
MTRTLQEVDVNQISAADTASLLYRAREAGCHIRPLALAAGHAATLQPFFLDATYTQRYYSLMTQLLRRAEASAEAAAFRLRSVDDDCIRGSLLPSEARSSADT